MSVEIYDVTQGTGEWFAARCGKVTASRIADVMAVTKTGPAATRKNYMAQLITERLTGEVAPTFSNAAMQWGTDTEPMAREAYEQAQLVGVERVGFVDHPTIVMSGASPDGLVGSDGLVEIKCPNTATHLETLESGKIADKYMKQMMWQMACTAREWCDFVSYDPRLPENMQLFIKRVERDDSLPKIEGAVTEFLAELKKRVDDLNAKYGAAA
jgi:putative phage-type endonuclease